MSNAMRDHARRRPWALDQMSIRAKLALVSGLVIVAFVALPTVSWYRDAAIRDMDDTRLEIAALDTMVLALQQRQADFITTFDPAHREDFSRIFERFVENTENLKARFWDLGLPIETLESLVALTSEYQYQFEVMAFTMTDIGPNDGAGLRKALHDRLAELEAGIAALPAGTARSELFFHLAMLRQPAQWLVSGRAKDAAGLFSLHAGHIENLLRDGIITDARRDALLTTLNGSQNAFVQLTQALKTVGLSYDEGVLGEIGQIVEESQDVVDSLRDQVNDAIERRETQLNAAIGAMAVLFTLSFLLAMVVLWRAISTPIRDVTQIMTRLADGQLSVEIPSDPRRDEIGDMFRALRVFKMGAIIRRRTQEELREAHAKLEQRVMERTAELSGEVTERRRVQKDLEHAREQAEAANQAKSLFLANMSHELRTPLNAIIGYAEMLKEDALEDGETRLAQDLEKIDGAGKHLLGIINEILDLSKIEAGRVELSVESFPVMDIVETVTNTVQPLIATNNNTLDLDIEGELGVMDSDMMRVRQVLFNFLSNAAKFTQNGTVTLGARREVDDTLVFTVTDTGIGMSTDELERIFEPFTQADASTTRKFGGTGLGLTVTRQLAHLLGGEVAVHSEPGQGTTFTVRLPVRAPQTSPTQPELPPETQPETQPETGPQK